jgi:hypothetical protein
MRKNGLKNDSQAWGIPAESKMVSTKKSFESQLIRELAALGLSPNRTWWQDGEGDADADQQSLMVQIDRKIYRKPLANHFFESSEKKDVLKQELENLLKEITKDQAG